mmetsp:Transcript_6613/g.14324  ORF Transcript_6613/g.14324 Transcript_6613/m.14324 type:complete len:169 (-) Transcript_6613:179-685(-)|eukprot:CAMPEP_0171332272 /NCGR_PEP_ID=MMETSP0878-20121228/3247_1 /TAXON_ID=67004 /ORGANISM="Thalassiosira weissflogii, Strain CCMP1336" /LENGTH=168 /DNA_ID=CAMNT_0011832971 /DNA_START=61 /DNA_END=567 /DNA_ORIENTATION=-
MIVSRNSFVVTLAIAAMAIPTASATPFASSDCIACESDFDSSNYLTAMKIIGGPIQLPSMDYGESSDADASFSDDHGEEDHYREKQYYDDAVSNATDFYRHSSRMVAPDGAADITDVRYYATWSSAEGELCSSKSSSSFDAWEESHATLEECCDVNFSWDYESCMGVR